MLDFPNIATTPSGITAGEELSHPMRMALASHNALPLTYHRVIEEGTYDDFKECIFRVCADRIFGIMMEDLAGDCHSDGIRCIVSGRTWEYASPLACFTKATMHMTIEQAVIQTIEINDYLKSLAARYGFVYNRMQTNHKAHRILPDGYAMVAPVMEVDAEIVWPYWM